MDNSKIKTIFISLSSPAVFRNLFFFPGSFFEQVKKNLKESDDYRIILLMSSHYQKKYGVFFEKVLPELNGKLIIETADISIKKNLWQRFFYFFYSYLIYTGTTKLMATMGTRPDEPPAGGKWYLAFLKILIARTFGNSKFIKLKIVPYLFLRIFKERSFKVFFEKYQPDLIFATHLYGWPDAQLIAEAKRQKVKTIGMPAGWDHLDKYFLPFHTDILLAQSEQVKEVAIKYQAYQSAEIVVTGYPHFDFISRQNYLMPREEILKSLGFPAEAKIVLYVSGSAYCPDEPDIIERILKWADEGKFGFDVRVVIRPYQGGRSKDKEFDQQKFDHFHSHPRVAFYQREFWGDLEKSNYFMNILAHADVVISVYSTMVLEAAVLDRPLMAIGFDGYQKRPFARSIRRFGEFEHFQDVLKTGALKTAYNFEELFGYLNTYLKDPRLDGEARKLLREKVCGRLDGLASQRISQIIF